MPDPSIRRRCRTGRKIAPLVADYPAATGAVLSFLDVPSVRLGAAGPASRRRAAGA